MGCVQGKASMFSPPRGLEKMKIQNEYAAGGGRNTQQRQQDRKSGRISRQELMARSGDKTRERQLVAREGERESGVSHRLAPKKVGDEEFVDGWPRWLVENIPKEALVGLVPKSAESYDKLDKIGQGTYSNVYKARDRDTGKIVALKKVRFDTSESESVRFMAREIMILQKLDHPNIVKLEGLATSRMQYSLYLVFDFMFSDLARVFSRPEGKLTEPQIKCYMQQLLLGLHHCHERGILHRDIKGSNLLIDRHGMLKIADFGLANYFHPNQKRPLTSRVVTLWYRAPELLLGSTDYGVAIDLWSAGCLLAEMLAGRPIMPGRNEVEQLHRIFKLCGSPSDDYWRKLKLPTSFRLPQPYKSTIMETFRDFPPSSLSLLTTLLALDPTYRGTASSALQSEFFITSPLACDLSGLPRTYKEEENEPIQNNRRKHGAAKRSRKHRESQRKKGETACKPKGGCESQEKERNVAESSSNSNNEMLSSTGSTSSSIRPSRSLFGESTTPTPSSVSHLNKMSPRTEGHPSATKNIKNKPTIPTITNTNRGINTFKDMNSKSLRFDHLRSISASDFRKLEGDELLKRYP